MEDVLEVYRRPSDPQSAVDCLDEQSKQLVKETKVPIASRPDRSLRVDYESERNGTANLFMRFEPLAGRRRVKVTERRTTVDVAHVIRELVDEDDPEAYSIVPVMDNLNPHKIASLYEAFDPAAAPRLVEKLAMHYTPKHNSWLNMAETELSIWTQRCLDRRLSDQPPLCRGITAGEQPCDEAQAKMDWQFPIPHARIKLKKLHPSIQVGKPTGITWGQAFSPEPVRLREIRWRPPEARLQ